MLGDLLYRLGRAMGTVEGLRRHVAGPSAADPADSAGGPFGEAPRGAADEDALEGLETAVMGAGAAWLVARLLRPRPVSWPRVVIAGVAATALADLVGRLVGHQPDDEGLPYAADTAELVGRFGAGIAVAAGYAALLYPRIPGPPLFRGLVFSALETAAAPRGGLVQLAAGTPGVRFPLQALARPVDEDAGPLSHLAFGLGLGLVYRHGAGRSVLEDAREEA